MRVGAWLGRGGVHPYVATSVTSKKPGFLVSWIVALIFGLIGALIWSVL